MNDDAPARQPGTLKPQVAGEPEPRPRPSGTYAQERMPSAERDPWRRDQHSAADGPDPSYGRESDEGHEMVSPPGGLTPRAPD